MSSPPTSEKPTMPLATTARLQRRHLMVAISFLILVAAPTIASAFYLYMIAADQYSSETSFTVQSEEFRNPLDALAGLGQISSGTSSDSEILYQYITSQKIIRDINEEIDLRKIFGRAKGDPIFTISDDATIEDLREHWKWRVRVTHERSGGLLNIEAIAFTPEDAQAINKAIIKESQKLIDQLSMIARDDATRYAEADLEVASERLKDTRRQLSEFRAQSNIVDPTIDVQSRGGVETALEQQLAEAMIAKDLLTKTTNDPNDPRLKQADNRIDSIRKRIQDERTSLSQGNSEGLIGVIGQYEELVVDREFAEKTYLSAAAAFDSARAEAKRRTKYMAVHIAPTLADSSLFPKRGQIIAMIFGFGLLIWALIVMIGYSLRDRG